MSIKVNNANFHKITNNYSFFTNIKDQYAVSLEKVRLFSENYIVSVVSKTLLASTALCYLKIPLATSFPLCLALVITLLFMNTLNGAKTAITKTISKAKTVITTTTEKGINSFIRVAEKINDIFKQACAGFKSLAVSLLHLIRENSSYSTPPLFLEQIDLTIAQEEPLAEESPVKAEPTPSKKPLLSCGSQFLINEKDRRGGFLLRGVSKEGALERLSSSLKGIPMGFFLKGNTPMCFFLENTENSPDRPLLKDTSERLLGNNSGPLSFEDIPENLLLEGIPVNLRSKN